MRPSFRTGYIYEGENEVYLEIKLYGIHIFFTRRGYYGKMMRVDIGR